MPAENEPVFTELEIAYFHHIESGAALTEQADAFSDYMSRALKYLEDPIAFEGKAPTHSADAVMERINELKEELCQHLVDIADLIGKDTSRTDSERVSWTTAFRWTAHHLQTQEPVHFGLGMKLPNPIAIAEELSKVTKTIEARIKPNEPVIWFINDKSGRREIVFATAEESSFSAMANSEYGPGLGLAVDNCGRAGASSFSNLNTLADTPKVRQKIFCEAVWRRPSNGEAVIMNSWKPGSVLVGSSEVVTYVNDISTPIYERFAVFMATRMCGSEIEDEYVPDDIKDALEQVTEQAIEVAATNACAAKLKEFKQKIPANIRVNVTVNAFHRYTPEQIDSLKQLLKIDEDKIQAAIDTKLKDLQEASKVFDLSLAASEDQK